MGNLLRELDGATPGREYPVAVFGHAELADAVGDFRDRWAAGIRELAADGAAVHRRLGETIDEYRRFDAEAARAFDRLRDGGNAG